MSEERPATTVPRVVAIEDNPADVRLIEEGIDATGIELELIVINSGQRAVERLTRVDDAGESDPNLILLDMNLPGKSGLEVLAVIRTESPFQNVPVVVVSSSQNPDDIERAYDRAANAYIMKPADPDEYIQMIDAALEFWLTTLRPTNE